MKIAGLSAYLMDGRCFMIMTVSMRNENVSRSFDNGETVQKIDRSIKKSIC